VLGVEDVEVRAEEPADEAGEDAQAEGRDA